MKKILLVTFLLFSLSSCFNTTSKEDLNKTKDNLLNWNSTWILESKTSWTWDLDSSDKGENKDISRQDIFVNYLTDEKFIEIDNFSISDFSDLEQEITWKTLTNVDKIIVSFTNPNSKFPKDTFELKKFKSWDKTFLYRAFKKYETLDYGENIYVFEAHSWDKISKLEYRVNIKNQIETPLEPISVWELPTSSSFWNPVELWDWKITYSDIKWLELEKLWETNLINDSDSVTNFLKSKYKNIFYWNTKRPISWEDGLSFFVVRVESDKYFYEKHYYFAWYYWILSLEEWDFTAEWTFEEKAKILSELNLSLKEKNDSYPMIKMANLLFQSLKK